MNARRLLLTPLVLALGLGTVLCALTGSRDAAAQAEARPSFILCMADDQGWGDVGYNGNPIPKTPVLDRMAATGLRFDRFYSASSVCSPTRGSVMTGRNPNRFGCFSWGHTLRPQEVTIAEALRKAGYTTGHFGKWHLGSVRPESPVSPGNSGFDEWVSSPNFFENDPLLARNGKVEQFRGESSRVTVDAALDFIRKASGKKQPFLAVVWFGSPHNPHRASEETRALYPDLKPALQHYYGEVTGIDRAMGHLRTQIRELGIASNTLVWYTSDNGPQGPAGRPGSAGDLKGRKGTLWEGGIRVPTIIEWPARVRKPAATTIPCGTVDIYPTLLELAGAKAAAQPQPLDGMSLVPLLEGKLTRRAKPLGFWDYPVAGIRSPSADLLKEQAEGKPSALYDDSRAGQIDRQYPEDVLPGHAAWIDGAYKLHRIAARNGTTTYQLFDLVNDRAETRDLAAEEPKRLQGMQSELEKWQKSVIRSLNGADYRK